MSIARRKIITALPALLAAPGLGQLLAACSSEPLQGPVAIKWDRDTCARCSMVISEPAYAAQIRDPLKRVHKFDDFGCAVFWREHQTFGDAEIEFWVADAGAAANSAGAWLAAQSAAYVAGKRTPMGYGIAATTASDAANIDYAAARKAVLAHGK